MITLTRPQILAHNPCGSGLAIFDAAAPSGTLTGEVVDLLRAHQPLCRFIGWAINKGLVARDVMKGADLTEANLYRADLTGADLTEADLTGSILPKPGERLWVTDHDMFPRHSKSTIWPEGFTPLTKAWDAE